MTLENQLDLAGANESDITRNIYFESKDKM